jgi:hypothetical protein
MFSSPPLIFCYHHPIIKCSNNLYLNKFGEAHQEEVNGELHVRMAATQTLIPLHLLTRLSPDTHPLGKDARVLQSYHTSLTLN